MAKTVFAIVALTVVLCLALGVFTQPAHAEDKSYMQRKGIAGLFAGGKDLKGKGPTKVQMWIGLGSIVVMIAVVKWL